MTTHGLHAEMKGVVVAIAVVIVLWGMVIPTSAQDDDLLICLSDEDCQATPNSYCFEEKEGGVNQSYCQCIPTHNNQSGTCLANKIGDACTRHTDCSDVIENSQCPQKVRKCRCKFGYVKNGDRECKPLEIGTPCKKNEQCQIVIDKSRCLRGSDGQRTCACMGGYIPEVEITDFNNKEIKITCVKSILGSSCDSPADCNLIGDHVTCVNGKCSCESGFTLDGANGALLCRPITLNELCSSGEDCKHIDNSVCQNDNSDNNDNTSKCVCDTGYWEDDNLSVCVRTILNTACDFDDHCKFSNSVCDFDTGFCSCEGRYEPAEDGSMCYIKNIGDACDTDDECVKFVKDSECSNKMCSCKDEYLPSNNNSLCVLPIIGHTNCTTNNTCRSLVLHSFCRSDDNICACQIGYDVTDDLNQCREKKLLDSCSSNDDCSTTNPFSECSGNSKLCQCVSGYVLDDSSPFGVKPFCRRRVLGRHDCRTQNDCSDAITNSTCVQCRDMKDDHLYCTTKCAGIDIEYCTISTCLCQTGFYPEAGGTQCKKRRLWDECSVDEDCFVNVAHSSCLSNGFCYCQAGFIPMGLDTCNKRLLEDVCHKDEDCDASVSNSYCNKNHRIQTLVDNNGSDGDQIVNVEGICSCQSGYNPVNGSACQRRRIGDKSCSAHSDCSDSVPGSMCSTGTCLCRPGYFPGFDLYSCTPRTLHGPYCSADGDCHAVIDHSHCSNHKCVCNTGYRVESDTECVRFKLNDAGCRDVQDCADAVENSTCSFGGGSGGAVSVCDCVVGFHPNIVTTATCVPRNISGHACQKDEDCSYSVANSYCQDDQCACVSGYYDKEGGTLCVKRILGNECNLTSDCDDVINNSTCNDDGVCTCQAGFEPDRNQTACFLKPQEVGSPCISNKQCQDIDVLSTCNASNGDVIKSCVCPNNMFVAESLRECVKLPAKVRDRCRWSSHCTRQIDNSFCYHGNGTCLCQDGFYEDEGGRTCSPLPEEFGDRCLQNSHCTQMDTHSMCDRGNNTCICQYGYTQVTSTQCEERPQIPRYKRYPDPKPPIECHGSCENQSNTICTETVQNSIFHCRCDHRYAKAYNKDNCVPVQTYLYTLRLTHEAGKYDYEPLPFKHQYKSSQLLAFKRFAQRITHNGIMQTIRKTALKFRYVSSEVLDFKHLESDQSNHSDTGVKVTILLHFEATHKYYGATSSRFIDSILRRELRRSNRELGTSKLLVGSPLKYSSVVSDFDECESPQHNDCSPQATCVNTLGSFMCVCRSDHVDVSLLHKKRKGRTCKVPDTTASDSALCSTANCETEWEFVALVLTLVFLLVIGFIVYEIIQRKQNFNARKLYERFGTTRIRKLKLTTEGLKRLQERKKYRKKFKKRMKKEMKRNKRKNRRRFFGGKKVQSSGTDGSDTERSTRPPSPSGFGTEEIPPTSSEFIHTPTIPIVVVDDDDDDEYNDDDADDVDDDHFPGLAGFRSAVTDRSYPVSEPDRSVTIFIDD